MSADFTENTVPWPTIRKQFICRRGDRASQICPLTFAILWCYLQNITYGISVISRSIREKLNATFVLLGNKGINMSFVSHLWEIFPILGEQGKRKLWVVSSLVAVKDTRYLDYIGNSLNVCWKLVQYVIISVHAYFIGLKYQHYYR